MPICDNLGSEQFSKHSAYAGYAYDPEQSFFFVMLRVRSTVLPRLVRNTNCWFVILLYTGIRLLKSADDSLSSYLPEMNISSLTVCVTFVSFMVTFYSQNTWQKYWSSYSVTQHLGGNINDFVVYADSYLGGKNDVALWELIRLINLMHHRFYAFIADENDSPEDRQFFLNDCLTIKLRGNPPGSKSTLCTEDELARLKRLERGTEYLVTMKWVVKAARQAIDTLPEHPSKPFQIQRLEEIMHQIRLDMGAVISQISRPMPLPYFHLVVFTVFICTTVYSYAAALLPSALSWIPMMAYTVGITGILEVTRVMSRPFGRDEVDLPALKFWRKAFDRSMEVLTEHDGSEGADFQVPPKETAIGMESEPLLDTHLHSRTTSCCR